ncbi:unnamed protein product [Soboliphyme baturini]|uniref:C-type lectin domain-containing protein n=1 Tax=Soboliphyme baturini TaxID=241478 RepID=A0A183IN37_9BILA|nr:unnamed protein product [Soboliphyme baturini]
MTLSRSITSNEATLGIHLRASAADGTYSIIAEVAVVPSPPDRRTVRVVFMQDALVASNDRGALRYSSAGDINPDLEATFCSFNYNGYNVYGNFSTSTAAVELDLYNTRNLLLQNSMFFKNQGGLSITVASSTPSTRLEGIIRNCAFGNNANFGTFRLVGRDYQKMYVLNSYFGFNHAPYHDVVYVEKVLTNFTHNVMRNNTGTHVVHISGYEDESAEYQTFYNNFVYENVATGHGYQFVESYGFFAADKGALMKLMRPRRQTEFGPRSQMTSFEWWANVGYQSERYRSTVFAGSAKQQYSMNFFQNPANNFELTTAVERRIDVYDGSIDAKNNYWGYPGTAAVAGAKIRDSHDYSYLIDVTYLPVLESNTTLLDGSCPAGWFQAGFEEWKSFRSCFLFVPGAATYRTAQEFCKSQNAYMPYFRDQDRRLVKLTEKIDQQMKRFTFPLERFSVSNMYETRIWVSSVNVPPEKCGYLSSKTGLIGIYNCEGMLPFVCEKGPKPFTEPLYWQPAGIAVFVVSFVLMFLIFLLGALWYVKSKHRKKQFFERKNSIRSSIRSLKLAQALENQQKKQQLRKSIVEQQQSSRPRASSPDLVEQAHRNLVLGARSFETLSNGKMMKPERLTSAPFVTGGTASIGHTDPTTLQRHSKTDRSLTSGCCDSLSAKNDRSSSGTGSNSSSFVSVTRSVLSYHEPKRLTVAGAPPNSFATFTGDTERYTASVRYDDPTLVTFRGGARRSRDITTASESSFSCTTCRTSTTGYDPSCSECHRNSQGLMGRDSHYTSEETLTACDAASEEAEALSAASSSSSRTASTTLMKSSGETINTLRNDVMNHDCEGPFLPNGEVRWPSSDFDHLRSNAELYRRSGCRKPIYFNGKSTPNLRDNGEEQSATSLLGPMAPSASGRSMNYLPTWTPPNLDSFNRSNDSDLVRPLETAM